MIFTLATQADASTRIKLQFDDMEIQTNGNGACYDTIEVRHHLIGQAGTRY